MRKEACTKVKSSSFFLDDNVPVILYGCGVRGIQFFHTLRARGVPIRCFFDANAAEGERLLDRPVYAPRAIPTDELEELRSALVLITLQNAGIHEEVARLLVHQGFTKLLYLPLAGDCFHDGADALRLRHTYLAYTEEQGLGEMHTVLPLTELPPVEYTERVILSKSDAFITAELPLDLLATDGCNHAAESFVHSPVAHLFTFFSTGEGDLAEIEARFHVHEEEFGYLLKKSFYEYVCDRQLLYGRFVAALSDGMCFFQTSPANGVWRDGYFAIEDGNHRVAFLYEKNLFCTPVRVTRDDYLRWRNQAVADRIIRECSEAEAARIFFWHPYTKKSLIPSMQADRILLRFLLMVERKLHDKESECLLYRMPKTRGVAVFSGFPPVSYPMLALSMEGYDIFASFEAEQDVRVAEMFFSLYYQDITATRKKDPPHTSQIFVLTWDYFLAHTQENACIPCRILVLVDIPEGQELPVWLLEKKELLRRDCIKANDHYYIKAWEMN